MYPKVKFEFFLDRKKVMDRLTKKQLRVLGQTGAFARTVMRRSIKPAKNSKRARTIVVDGQALFVPQYGLVLDAKTMKPVRTALADEARRVMAAKQRSEGAGQPPRSRTGLLKDHIYFAVDGDSEKVIIAPLVFKSQPRGLVKVESVPELLERGGWLRLKDVLVKYQPRPYVSPVRDVAVKKMRELVVKVKL